MHESADQEKQRPALLSPATIVLMYMLAGILWVVLSNGLLVRYVHTPRVLTSIEIVKDGFFILLTAGLLYLLIKRGMQTLYRSEEALLESKRTLSTLLSNLPGIVYRCLNDSNWTMEFVSDGCSVLTGYDPSDLMHNNKISYAQMIHPDDQEMVWNDVQSALHDNRPFQITYRIRTAGGEEKWVWEQGRQVPSPEGAPATLEGFITDITLQVKAIEELKKHQDHLEVLVKERTRDLESAQRILIQREKLRTLGVIAAEVAHEIRNPLVAVGGFARRLFKKYPHLHECGIIYQESQRLEKILDRITHYLKPVTLHRVPCFVNDIIAECIDLLLPEIERRKITCTFHLEKEQSVLHADTDVLSQVIINLIHHAMEAIGENGELQIRSYEDAHQVYVDFKSPRIVCAHIDAELLFMPFDEGGESIGLPLAYRLVKDMGGVLSFSQEEHGILFTVAFLKSDLSSVS
jgi:signal transduction histidine kinase